MPDEESARHREVRAMKRAHWPVKVFELGHEPPEHLLETTSVAERLGMMWSLALDAWAAAGRSIPDYDRSSMPSRIFRPGEEPPEHRVTS